MKRHLVLFFAVGVLASGANAQTPPPPTRPAGLPPGLQQPAPVPAAPPKDFSKIFKDDKEKISYAIGMNFGAGLHGNLASQEVDFDPEVLMKGFKEALTGAPTLVTSNDVRDILMEFQTAMRTKQKKKWEDLGEKNAKEGPAFLAANKDKAGVVTLPSGLQYKILVEGTGEKPKTNDIVTVNYKGTLIDGTEFDSSAKRGKPADFPLRPHGLIDAWLEAMPMMKTGAKWEIYVPSELGYKAAGEPRGKIIGPNAALIFEIELVSFKTPPPPPALAQHPGGAPGAPGAAPLTSDIIKVPSAEELKKGAQIQTIKPEDIEKEKAKEKAEQANPPK